MGQREKKNTTYNIAFHVFKKHVMAIFRYRSEKSVSQMTQMHIEIETCWEPVGNLQGEKKETKGYLMIPKTFPETIQMCICS